MESNDRQNTEDPTSPKIGNKPLEPTDETDVDTIHADSADAVNSIIDPADLGGAPIRDDDIDDDLIGAIEGDFEADYWRFSARAQAEGEEFDPADVGE